MRHRKKTVILDRTKGPRKALLTNLAESVILYEKVETTQAKAKAVRPIVEKLITRAKEPTLANIRQLESKLYTKNAVAKLTKKLGPRYKERNGGYTRIVKLGNRAGDGAQMAYIELV